MHGMMKGIRTLDFLGELNIADESQGYFANFIFNPEKKGWVKSWFSSQKTSFDHYEGIITNVRNFKLADERGKSAKQLVKESGGRLTVHCQAEGAWLSHIKFGKDKYWDIDDVRPFEVRRINNPLPSDSRFRIDLIALEHHALKKA